MTTLQEIKNKIEAIQKQKEELTAQLRKDFAPMLMPLFEKTNGKIKSIGWSQYTPYFNDGEECTFSTNLDMDYGIMVNGQTLEDREDDLFGSDPYSLNLYISNIERYNKWVSDHPEYTLNESTKENDLEIVGYVKEFYDLLSSIDDEFYKDLFGDHVEVTINADGTVETNEYNHD